MLEILNLPPQAMPPQTCLNEKMAHTLIHTHTHTQGKRETFGCKFIYAMNFFRSLKINRNKVQVGYSHSQMIYLPHTITKHKLNPRPLLDVA